MCLWLSCPRLAATLASHRLHRFPGAAPAELSGCPGHLPEVPRPGRYGYSTRLPAVRPCRPDHPAVATPPVSCYSGSEPFQDGAGATRRWRRVTGPRLPDADAAAESDMEHRLERYYCGDDAWRAFVEALSSRWATCPFKQELVSTLHDQTDSATAVYGTVGDSSLAWVAEAVPSLDGLRPVDCTLTAELTLRLRSMLMRMPL
jgi:hypothetical protein